ncbi:MAG: hypothetical protein WCL51_01280 [Bacteroidota bacterium]
MKERKSGVLCDEKSGNISIYVNAYIDKGSLQISGQDLGEDLIAFFGDSEYEYFYEFNEKNTKLLHEKLIADCQQGKGLIDFLEEHFSGIDGCKNLRAFCKKNKVHYEFHVR